MTEKAIPLTRTPIFTAMTHDYDWSKALLTAIASAKALGVPRLEIDVTEESREVPVIESRGTDTFGMPVRVQTGKQTETTKRVQLFAIRVEVSDVN